MGTQKQKIKWKSVLVGIIIGAIVVGIIAVGFWYVTRPKESTTSSTNITKTTTTSANPAKTGTGAEKTTVPCASTLTDSDKIMIETWKTYENSKYKYSFKYPENWIVSNDSDNLVELKDNEADLTFQFLKGVDLAQNWNVETTTEVVVVCQKSIKKLLSAADDPSEKGLSTTFVHGEDEYHVFASYKYIGASLSSDIVEAYDLILKTIEFK
jgi:hypothetical protein